MHSIFSALVCSKSPKTIGIDAQTDTSSINPFSSIAKLKIFLLLFQNLLFKFCIAFSYNSFASSNNSSSPIILDRPRMVSSAFVHIPARYISTFIFCLNGPVSIAARPAIVFSIRPSPSVSAFLQ